MAMDAGAWELIVFSAGGKGVDRCVGLKIIVCIMGGIQGDSNLWKKEKLQLRLFRN
jgi:hypothetical protein